MIVDCHENYTTACGIIEGLSHGLTFQQVCELILPVFVSVASGVWGYFFSNSKRDGWLSDLIQSGAKIIFDAVWKKLTAALMATGPAQIPAAQSVLVEINLYLGPVVLFCDPLNKCLKDLEAAIKGRVKQTRVCDCNKCLRFNCADGSVVCPPATGTNQPPGGPGVIIVPGGAAAASAGGGASASSVGGGPTVVIQGASGGSASVPPQSPRLGGPSTLPCTCDCGPLVDVKPAAPSAVHERAMTSEEQALAARKAIEAIAQFWTPEIVGKLVAINHALLYPKVTTTVVSKRNKTIKLEG